MWGRHKIQSIATGLGGLAWPPPMSGDWHGLLDLSLPGLSFSRSLLHMKVKEFQEDIKHTVSCYLSTSTQHHFNYILLVKESKFSPNSVGVEVRQMDGENGLLVLE